MAYSAVSVDKNSVKIFDMVTITITPAEDGCLHTLEYAIGTVRKVLDTNRRETEYQWFVPDLIGYFNGAEEGMVTIYCTTVKNGQYLGCASCEINVNGLVGSSPSVDQQAVCIGEKVVIRTNRLRKEFTHKLYYQRSTDAQLVLIAENVVEAYVWTVPIEILDLSASEIEREILIRCDTFYGGEQLAGNAGSGMVAVTVAVPAKTLVTVAESTVEIGKKVKVALQAVSEIFTHNVFFNIDNEEIGALEQLQPGEHSWTVPDSALAYMAGTEAQLQIVCNTMLRINNTDVWIGSDRKEVALTVGQSAALLPKLTVNVTAENKFNNATLNNNTALFVQGFSWIRISYDGTVAATGAQIASCVTEVMGVRLTGDNVRTKEVIPVSGTLLINCTVTDSRGFSKTEPISVYVRPYSKPKLVPLEGEAKVRCMRCDADGKPNRKGTSLRIRAGVRFQKVYDQEGSQVNYVAVGLKINGKAVDPEEFRDLFYEDQNFNITVPGVLSDTGKAYRVTLALLDNIGGASNMDIPVPPAFAVYHVPRGGNGFTLGGYHDSNKPGFFDCWFKAEFEKDVHGRALGLGGLPELKESNKNVPGAYAVSAEKAAALLELPAVPGTLRVWNSDGQEDEKAEYRIQEFVCADNSAVYRRGLHYQDNTWQEGQLKEI